MFFECTSLRYRSCAYSQCKPSIVYASVTIWIICHYLFIFSRQDTFFDILIDPLCIWQTWNFKDYNEYLLLTSILLLAIGFLFTTCFIILLSSSCRKDPHLDEGKVKLQEERATVERKYINNNGKSWGSDMIGNLEMQEKE